MRTWSRRGTILRSKSKCIRILYAVNSLWRHDVLFEVQLLQWLIVASMVGRLRLTHLHAREVFLSLVGFRQVENGLDHRRAHRGRYAGMDRQRVRNHGR